MDKVSTYVVMPPKTGAGMATMAAANLAKMPMMNSQIQHAYPACLVSRAAQSSLAPSNVGKTDRLAICVRAITPLFCAKVVVEVTVARAPIFGYVSTSVTRQCRSYQGVDAICQNAALDPAVEHWTFHLHSGDIARRGDIGNTFDHDGHEHTGRISDTALLEGILTPAEGAPVSRPLIA